MSDLICRKSMQRCLHPGMCSPHGGCQPDKSEWQSGYEEGRRMGAKTALDERDQLKAENEELKQNVYYSDQIIETRNRLLKLIPPCPVHGEECVPHAMEWVSAALAKERAQ